MECKACNFETLNVPIDDMDHSDNKFKVIKIPTSRNEPIDEIKLFICPKCYTVRTKGNIY